MFTRFFLAIPLLAPGLHPDERTITLEAGQSYSATIEPKGAEFAATLYAPGGKQLMRDSHRVFTFAESSGSFRLEITPLAKGPSTGSYALRTEGPRQATPQDRQRMQALSAFIEAQQVEKPGTPDTRRQAIPRYEAALQLWREAGDPEAEGNSLTAIRRP